MNSLSPIIEEFDLHELNVPPIIKKGIKPAVEYLVETNGSFSAAIHLSSLILQGYPGKLKVADAFADAHPENRVEVYSSPDVFLAFYLLMLAAKANNLYNAREEIKAGQCAKYALSCVGDHETCSLCREKTGSSLLECTYETVPPFHVGCRCGMIFKAE